MNKEEDIVIEMYGELYTMKKKTIYKWGFSNIKRYDEVFFITTKDGTLFSCHENFWIPFHREYKIDKIVSFNS